MKVALYARVSTYDQQTLPMQLEAMREFAEKRNWIIESEIEEIASGAKNNRPKRAEIIKLARQRKIDAIIVWRLDRWGRSTLDLAQSLEELQTLGVDFVSITEALDFTTPAGKAMAQLLSVFAEYERNLISERIKAGMAQAKAKGKKVGRPATAQAKADKVKRLFFDEKIKNKSEIARRLKIDVRNVRRILKKS